MRTPCQRCGLLTLWAAMCGACGRTRCASLLCHARRGWPVGDTVTRVPGLAPARPPARLSAGPHSIEAGKGHFQSIAALCNPLQPSATTLNGRRAAGRGGRGGAAAALRAARRRAGGGRRGGGAGALARGQPGGRGPLPAARAPGRATGRAARGALRRAPGASRPLTAHLHAWQRGLRGLASTSGARAPCTCEASKKLQPLHAPVQAPRTLRAAPMHCAC